MLKRKKTQKHITTCCVFVFFCLKSSWLFLPCVFCVFVFFSCSNCSLVTFVPFIFVMFFVLPDHQFCRFSSSSNFHFFGTCSMCCCLFSFYFLFSFSLPFFMLILFSFFLFVFKILLSRTLSLFLFMLHFVLLSDGAAVSLLPSESNQTKLWKWVPHSIFLAIQQNVQSTI